MIGSPAVEGGAGPPSRRGAGPLRSAREVLAKRRAAPVGPLLVLATVLSVIDWVFPLRWYVAYPVAVLFVLLLVPWSMALFRSDAESDADQAKAPPRSARALLVHLTVFLLFGAFLVAKWLVLLRSSQAPAEFVGSARSYTLAVYAVFAFGLLTRGLRLKRFVALVADHPARLMALSFGVTGVLGAMLLSLPFSVETVRSVSLVDNLFMAFSAVCVTGLAVNNVAETYSLAGQAVLCLLIQIGGLGIMVLSAAIAVLAGQKLRVKSSAVLAELVDVSSLASLRRLVVMIIVYTLVIEAAGAALLYADFSTRPELARRFGGPLAGPGDARWAAVFHAVSAFCNAGFSNANAGLLPFVGSPLVLTTVTALIVLGGIGFPVLDELSRTLVTRLRGRRAPMLSLHTRVALRTSGLLLVAMALAHFVFEWSASMKNLSFLERLAASIFQSASARTAGFNVVDVGAMSSAVLVLTCAAMFVGASPGGTGGGIKTTTLAVLYAGLRSELLARPAELLNRAVPQAVIRRAIGVAFLSMTLVFTVLVLMLLIEPHPPLAVTFEVVSAFSTTGLSTGITPSLSVPGKLLITLTMFIGRIGPLTLALALARAAKARALELPEERVMIG